MHSLKNKGLFRGHILHPSLIPKREPRSRQLNEPNKLNSRSFGMRQRPDQEIKDERRGKKAIQAKERIARLEQMMIKQSEDRRRIRVQMGRKRNAPAQIVYSHAER